MDKKKLGDLILVLIDLASHRELDNIVEGLAYNKLLDDLHDIYFKKD